MTSVESSDHVSLVKELSEFYRQNNFEVEAEFLEFPENSSEPEGQIDLLLDDRQSTGYKAVNALYTRSMDSKELQVLTDKKETEARKASKYFEKKIQNSVKPEVVIGTDGRLNTIREIWENTTGVFTRDQAVEAVSEPGRLGNFRDNDFILLDYEISRKENEESFRLSPELDEITDIFLEYETYP